MNNAVTVEDGFGGLVIITRVVDTFASADKENGAKGLFADDVTEDQPAIVEVCIECDDDPSITSSDEGFRGFFEKEIDDSRESVSYIKNVSLIQYQSHSTARSRTVQIDEKGQNDGRVETKNIYRDSKPHVRGGNDPTFCAKFVAAPKTAVRCGKSQVGSTPSTSGKSSKFTNISENTQIPSFGLNGKVFQSRAAKKENAANLEKSGRVLKRSAASIGVPKSPIEYEYCAEIAGGYDRTSLKSSGNAGHAEITAEIHEIGRSPTMVICNGRETVFKDANVVTAKASRRSSHIPERISKSCGRDEILHSGAVKCEMTVASSGNSTSAAKQFRAHDGVHKSYIKTEIADEQSGSCDYTFASRLENCREDAKPTAERYNSFNMITRTRRTPKRNGCSNAPETINRVSEPSCSGKSDQNTIVVIPKSSRKNSEAILKKRPPKRSEESFHNSPPKREMAVGSPGLGDRRSSGASGSPVKTENAAEPPGKCRHSRNSGKATDLRSNPDRSAKSSSRLGRRTGSLKMDDISNSSGKINGNSICSRESSPTNSINGAFRGFEVLPLLRCVRIEDLIEFKSRTVPDCTVNLEANNKSSLKEIKTSPTVHSGGSVSGLNKGSGAISCTVARKNKRKTSRVRKHPLYVQDNLLNDVRNEENPAATANFCGCLKMDSSPNAAADEVIAGRDLKRSSRVKKIPAKFRDGGISDFSWLNTNSFADSKVGEKKQEESKCLQCAAQKETSGTDRMAISNVFPLNNDSFYRSILSPGKRKMMLEMDAESSSDPDDPDSSPKKKIRKNVARAIHEGRMALLAEYRAQPNGSPSGARDTDDGHMRYKPWSCKLCSFKTVSEQNLKLHLRAHTREQYQCQQCPYLAMSKTTLKIHMRKHTGEKPYKCTSCEYSCTTSAALKIHVRNHIGDKQFSCPMCDHKALTKSHLTVHIRTHTGVKPFSCDYCSYKTATSGHLKRHSAIHTGEKPFKCSLCNYASARSSCLKIHMKTHETGKLYQCSKCEYSADFPISLKRHMFEHAVDEHFYKCSHCNFTTAAPAALRNHVRVHSCEEPRAFQCVMCSYANLDFHHVRSHMKIHAGETPYRCRYCSYTTTVSNDFQRHLAIHTGKRPYRCDSCPKKYKVEEYLKLHKKSCEGSTKQGLSSGGKGCDKQKTFSCSKCEFTTPHVAVQRAHRRTHAETLKYQCYECGYGCNTRFHFIMHTRIHNGVKPFTCPVCSFETSVSLRFKRHKFSHKELWPFSCKDCGEKFLHKTHLNYHKEKGCDSAGLAVKSKEVEVSDLSSDENVDPSPKKKFSRRAFVKKIVRQKSVKVDTNWEEDEDFSVSPSKNGRETSVESLDVVVGNGFENDDLETEKTGHNQTA